MKKKNCLDYILIKNNIGYTPLHLLAKNSPRYFVNNIDWLLDNLSDNFNINTYSPDGTLLDILYNLYNNSDNEEDAKWAFSLIEQFIEYARSAICNKIKPLVKPYENSINELNDRIPSIKEANKNNIIKIADEHTKLVKSIVQIKKRLTPQSSSVLEKFALTSCFGFIKPDDRLQLYHGDVFSNIKGSVYPALIEDVFNIIKGYVGNYKKLQGDKQDDKQSNGVIDDKVIDIDISAIKPKFS